MPALSMLLQVVTAAQAAAQSADVRFMDWGIRLAPIALSIWIYLQAPSREARKAQDKALADLLTAKELQQATNTNHQLAMEKIGDEMKRGQQEHEQKISQLSDMKTDVAVMKSQLETQTRSFQEMNQKLDRLLNQGNK